MLPSCKLQDRNFAKFQVERYELCLVTNCKIGTLLRFKLQDRKLAKLQVAI